MLYEELNIKRIKEGSGRKNWKQTFLVSHTPPSIKAKQMSNNKVILVHNPLIISANEPPMIQFKTISKHIVISIHKKKGEKRVGVAHSLSSKS